MTDKLITVKQGRKNTVLTLALLTCINTFVLLMGVTPNRLYDAQPWMFIVADLAVMFGLMFLFTIGWSD